jgi:hypothetical protein
MKFGVLLFSSTKSISKHALYRKTFNLQALRSLPLLDRGERAKEFQKSRKEHL